VCIVYNSPLPSHIEILYESLVLYSRNENLLLKLQCLVTLSSMPVLFCCWEGIKNDHFQWREPSTNRVQIDDRKSLFSLPVTELKKQSILAHVLVYHTHVNTRGIWATLHID